MKNKWVITNLPTTKGVVVEAETFDEALSLAPKLFYSPYVSRIVESQKKREFTMGQVLDELDPVHSTRKFKKVHYVHRGGVCTNYNCTIITPMTEQQKKFCKGHKFEFVRFHNGEGLGQFESDYK